MLIIHIIKILSMLLFEFHVHYFIIYYIFEHFVYNNKQKSNVAAKVCCNVALKKLIIKFSLPFQQTLQYKVLCAYTQGSSDDAFLGYDKQRIPL